MELRSFLQILYIIWYDSLPLGFSTFSRPEATFILCYWLMVHKVIHEVNLRKHHFTLLNATKLGLLLQTDSQINQ
jgi:hypothetical protein